MAVVDRIHDIIAPLVAAVGLEVYDIETNAGTLRVTVDAAGGVTLDQLAQVTRQISRALDDDDPIPGSYTLEVSSPGLERRLRLPEHFAGAIGEEVNVKLGPHVDGERRIRGRLQAAGTDRITVVDDGDTEHELQIDDITKAVTVFEWGPAPKPGSPGSKKKKSKRVPEASATSDESELEREASAQ